MSITSSGDARLNFRIAADLKRTIEEAAAQLGQSVADFAVSTLVETAETVVGRRSVTKLSKRDRDLFISLLDDMNVAPNAALKRAAVRYRECFGRKPAKIAFEQTSFRSSQIASGTPAKATTLERHADLEHRAAGSGSRPIDIRFGQRCARRLAKAIRLSI
jgi:uncharacterized protein (DUF1778 family)